MTQISGAENQHSRSGNEQLGIPGLSQVSYAHRHRYILGKLGLRGMQQLAQAEGHAVQPWCDETLASRASCPDMGDLGQ